jgi:hypothetical protein
MPGGVGKTDLRVTCDLGVEVKHMPRMVAHGLQQLLTRGLRDPYETVTGTAGDSSDQQSRAVLSASNTPRLFGVAGGGDPYPGQSVAVQRCVGGRMDRDI